MGKRHQQRKSSASCRVSAGGEESGRPTSMPVQNFQVQHSDVMGRYLVAGRTLEPGDVIMERVEPLVVGPCQNVPYRQPICLGCYNFVDGIYRCAGCRWPMCGSQCPGFGSQLGHSPQECGLLSKVDVKEVDNVLRMLRADAGEAYNPIVPLRCLLLKKNLPDRWKELNELESHDEVRRTSYPELWASNQRAVVDVIIQKWKIMDFTEDEIHRICGYLEVNSFSIGGHGGSVELRGLYGGNVSLMCHNCTPNTTHIDDESLGMTVRASVSITKGDPIAITYASSLQGTLQRRKHLRESKFFQCSCRRCSDPTELGTMMSALRCTSCRAGNLLPSKPLQDESLWRCSSAKCRTSLNSHQVEAILSRIEADLESIKEGDVEDFEGFLKRHEEVLHPNHYLMVGAKYPLSQMYGKSEGHMIHQMSEDELMRKVYICRQLMKLFNVIEPGMSRIRGVTLYELHAPLFMLAQQRLASRRVAGKEAKGWLREVAACLEEACKILALEPEGCSEHVMATAAKDALLAIQHWQHVISAL